MAENELNVPMHPDNKRFDILFGEIGKRTHIIHRAMAMLNKPESAKNIGETARKIAEKEHFPLNDETFSASTTRSHLVSMRDKPGRGFAELVSRGKWQLTARAKTLLAQSNKVKTEIENSKTSQRNVARSSGSESNGQREQLTDAPLAVDLGEPPARIATTTYRIVRDTRLADWTKKAHNYKCQICGVSIKLADGSGYAEGHHIKPLGSPHNGPDVIDNILCVCPNHHAMCDFGAIELDLEKLETAEGHSLNQKYLDYHNQKIFKG
ncbi:HNH endonuclease [Telmatocola sphagniphila]|uniref:HNH endonuclease n=1 Tax=Telmatocola sphagniphila TaxID=1123043 RepID=A0A8E6B4J5_9BACT|nr:HNH endonuclease [Telmatocola sphagniphila]QVL30245.1 HNH endonuclease [Telmatocola sphagniphila]